MDDMESALRESLLGTRVLWVRSDGEIRPYVVDVVKVAFGSGATPTVLIDDKNTSWNWDHIVNVNQSGRNMG